MSIMVTADFINATAFFSQSRSFSRWVVPTTFKSNSNANGIDLRRECTLRKKITASIRISTTISTPSRCRLRRQLLLYRGPLDFRCCNLTTLACSKLFTGAPGTSILKARKPPYYAGLSYPGVRRRITPETFAGAQAHGKTAHRAMRLYVFS